MTYKDLRQKLFSLTDAEIDAFRKKFGGDQDREGYVQWFMRHQSYEAQMADLLGLPTEAEKVPVPQLTQNFNGNPSGFFGHNQGQVNFTVIQFLGALEKAVENDPTIPEPEKKTLLGKLKDLAMNPYISNLATSGLWDLAKGMT